MKNHFAVVVALLPFVASPLIAQPEREMHPPIHPHPQGLTARPSGYAPAQIRSAYGIDTVINGGNAGAGQKIAIVDAYGSGSIQNDLNAFCTTFGLPQTTVQVVGK